MKLPGLAGLAASDPVVSRLVTALALPHLTNDGEQFARDARPVLESLTRSQSKNASHAQ
jgi:mevalonate pyrophosphate decarboxylase